MGGRVGQRRRSGRQRHGATADRGGRRSATGIHGAHTQAVFAVSAEPTEGVLTDNAAECAGVRPNGQVAAAHFVVGGVGRELPVQGELGGGEAVGV